jgi:hypothetical protein
VFAILATSEGIDPEQLYYIENIASDDLSFIIDAGITDGLSLLEASKAITIINLTEGEIVLTANKHVANVFPCDEQFILSEKDQNRTNKMKLYEEYQSISNALMISIGKYSEDTPTSTQGIACTTMGSSHTSEAFKSQRTRIQALSSTDIQYSLKHGTLSIQEVTAHIVPCIDLFCGIGGFSKGVHNVVKECGKMFKIFLALDNDSTRLRSFQRNNTGIPTEKHRLGEDIILTKRLIESFVHPDLFPYAYAHAHPPCATTSGIETLLNTRMVHWSLALLTSLSPSLTWTMEHKPNACHEISAAPNIHARTINFNEYAALGVQCRRIILSNQIIELPERKRPTTLSEKLGHQYKGKHLMQFNNFNAGKPIDAEGYPLVIGIPLKVGSNLKNAHQLTLDQIKTLTGMDTYDIQDLGKGNPKGALVECTPPTIAKILANAVKKLATTK